MLWRSLCQYVESCVLTFYMTLVMERTGDVLAGHLDWYAESIRKTKSDNGNKL